MNILILNWRDIKNPEGGGAEIILYELVKRLVKKGNSVTWFCSGFKNSSEEEVQEGIKIIRSGGKYSVFFHAFQYYRSLKVKPDIVLDCVNTACWQTPLYVSKDRRVLYTNQAAREVFFYEYPFPFSILAYLVEPLQYLTYKNTDVVCYSNSTKEDLISLGIDKKNIYVFPLGLDHKRYYPQKKSENPTFIFVARFVRNKRPERCVSAMIIVISKYPKAKLYLIGYGKEEKNLKTQIEKLKLKKNVFIVNKNNFFLKRDMRDEKVRLMQQAWALILPSVKEGWGMVVTEAAACGTPSIVSNVTGLRDSVIHKRTGTILSSNPSPTEIANALISLIENKDRSSLYQNSIKWSKNFSWSKSFNNFNNYLLNHKLNEK
ncbi:MAG: glycosyltransferase family 4 protein [Candidatus Levybacteria bacterium]|nr:glycosyltransferase family 4 protein [Candidatus Levybacteria bacterium]